MSDHPRQPAPSTPTPPAHVSLLSVEDLVVEFHSRDGIARVLNGVSFHLHPSETLAILGESGSGKSVTALAIMGLLDTPPARIGGGRICFRGQDLLATADDERRQTRGRDIAMIFQDAFSALNPVFPVGWQIAETLRRRAGLSRQAARAQAIELLERVRIPDARTRVGDYPHQFSGGMRQRVMIAMALALGPQILIADEPTTALDVTVQAQIMDLLADLRRETGMAMILITHDLGVVADVADRIAVMYAGRVVEHADATTIYATPAHPYTRALLDSIPRLDRASGPLTSIKGLPPNLLRLPPGCAFHPRCPRAEPVCATDTPPAIDLGPHHRSLCHFAREVLGDA